MPGAGGVLNRPPSTLVAAVFLLDSHHLHHADELLDVDDAAVALRLEPGAPR